MAKKKPLLEVEYDLSYNGSGDFGMNFSFRCICGESLNIKEDYAYSLCPECGREWHLALFVECIREVNHESDN